MNVVLPITKKELRRAKSSLDKMQTCKSIDDFQDLWTDFLDHIQKVWKKSEEESKQLGVSSKFYGWRSKFMKNRKDDPLLQYLHQSRNCDQHNLEEIIKETPSHTTLNFVNQKGGHIKHLSIIDNVVKAYEGDAMEVMHHSAEIKAIPVKNWNVTYAPPKEHQGKPLASYGDPFEIGSLGFLFYENYVRELEQKFFT